MTPWQGTPHPVRPRRRPDRTRPGAPLRTLLALAGADGAAGYVTVGPAGWDCFLSVKSVDRIEVTREPQQATAAMIALARLERETATTPATASRRDE